MATKSRDVLHGREESEIAEDLDEVVESDERAGLGEREVQRVEHGPDTEGQEQHARSRSRTRSR